MNETPDLTRDLTRDQFIAEVAALLTPAETVAQWGEAMPDDLMVRLLDSIICEARRLRDKQREEGQ